ncbi:MAG TPA: hypothetical protein V6D05_08350 [Stenomitos sp.]
MQKKSFPRRIKTQAQILSAFVQAFGRTLITQKRATPEEQALSEIAPGSMRVWAQNARLFFDDAVVLKLRDFVADLQVKDPEAPLIPELKDSYVFAIRQGQIRISAASMEALLNRYVLPAAGNPIKDARLAISGDRVVLRGKVHKMGLDLPITLESEVSIGAGGLMELLPHRIALSEVGIGGMIKLFKLELESLMELPSDGAFRVQGNQITVDPAEIFPSPKAIGRPSAIGLERNELVLTYTPEESIEPAPLIDPDAPNYMLCLGHDLLVGKMMMHDAYFQIINQEPANFVDFSLEHYREQLAAGNSSLHSGDQLVVRLPSLEATRRSTGPLPRSQGTATP